MTDNKPMMLYTATYDSVSAAMTDLDAIEQLHKHQVIGKYDAAVIDKALTGADTVVKHTVDATADEITSELQEALKS